ncbi:MAG: hypothetical protein AAFW83_02410 [Pseudomonadota bacterium]
MAPLLPSTAQTLPAPVDTALSRAEADNEIRVSYTMTFQWFDGPQIKSRFDAREKAWTVVSGNPDALPAKARKKYETYKRVESKPGGLTYADYRKHLRSVALIEESPETLTYSFVSPQTPDDLEAVGKTVRTRLEIDRQTVELATYFVEALAPFKPNAFSRLDAFYFRQTFEKKLPGAPALMTEVIWQAKGKRFLTSIDEDYRITFSDFSRVDP